MAAPLPGLFDSPSCGGSTTMMGTASAVIFGAASAPASATTEGRDEAYLDSLVIHLTGFESEAECSQRFTQYKQTTQAEYRARHSAGAGRRSGGPRRKCRTFHPLIYQCSAYKASLSTGRSAASRQRKQQQVQYQQVQCQQSPPQHYQQQSATASIFGGLA